MFFPTAQKLMHVFESNPIVHIQRAVIIVLILRFSNIKSSFCEQNYQSETNWGITDALLILLTYFGFRKCFGKLCIKNLANYGERAYPQYLINIRNY